MLRDLRQAAGGFSSAEDADSPGPDGHGHEGLFHTWTPDEVRAVLGDDTDDALNFWAIGTNGNFEGRSIPNRLHERGRLARPPVIEDARRRLFEARQQRPRPGLDDKVLTEWNALMISALAEAGALLGPAGLDRRRRRGRRLPAPRAAAARRAVVPVLARRRHAAGPSRRAGCRPRLPRRRLHPSRRGHRRGTVDRRGPDGGRHDARPLLGRRPRRAVHDRRRRRGARRPPEGPVRQRHPVGQLDGRRRPVPARRAHRRGALRQPRRPHPAARSARSSTRRHRRSPTPWPRSPCTPTGSPRS